MFLCQNSCFQYNCKYGITKLNTESIPFSNRKDNGRKKLATKEKIIIIIKKITASANINSREMFQIE